MPIKPSTAQASSPAGTKSTNTPAGSGSTLKFNHEVKTGVKVIHELDAQELEALHAREADKEAAAEAEVELEEKELELDGNDANADAAGGEERKGLLVCNGTAIDSEVIYWKIVPGDASYESPITPHHADHHDKYLTFEYDAGGWNNVRMGMECLLVVAHAMGRTLVVPPQQHLYLLGQTHKDKHDSKAHDEMGFEDFFDLEVLRSHRGFHVLHMKEFLEQEGVTGGLKGTLPPRNSSDAWGSGLWHYLKKVPPLEKHRYA
jgi:hypothetical protein